MELKSMDNIKDDNYFIRKIVQDLQFIVDHMENVDQVEFTTITGLQQILFTSFKLRYARFQQVLIPKSENESAVNSIVATP